jgi:tryptophanyl-tRNA synthetase
VPKRVLSGMRPTNRLHLGNALGALENWKKCEGDDSYFMIADWHALTTEYESKTRIKQNALDVVIDYLAAGLDPKKSTIFLQSLVSEHAELALMLSMMTPISWLERNPTYKDQLKEQKGKELTTHGFLGYPVLQTADILLYKANAVPVGEDQLPHLELGREIARRFNFLYKKNVFVEAEAILTKTPKVPGLDGRKMSKSYGNTIDLSDVPDVVDKKVMQMVTDPARKRRSDKGHPDVCPVFYFHKIFNKENGNTVAEECREAARGCVDCKKEMLAHLRPFTEPIYEKRKTLEKKKDSIKAMVLEGSLKAKLIASATLEEAKEAVGIGI